MTQECRFSPARGERAWLDNHGIDHGFGCY
jgi:hypothetical protein